MFSKISINVDIGKFHLSVDETSSCVASNQFPSMLLSTVIEFLFWELDGACSQIKFKLSVFDFSLSALLDIGKEDWQINILY